MRIVEIPIKPGMLRQALVTFNVQKRNHIIKVGETLDIECPDLGLRFSTELVISTARLRERSAFAKIFKRYAVDENDVLVLTEQTKGKWILTVRKRPKGLAAKINELKKQKRDQGRAKKFTNTSGHISRDEALPAAPRRAREVRLGSG